MTALKQDESIVGVLRYLIGAVVPTLWCRIFGCMPLEPAITFRGQVYEFCRRCGDGRLR